MTEINRHFHNFDIAGQSVQKCFTQTSPFSFIVRSFQIFSSFLYSFFLTFFSFFWKRSFSFFSHNFFSRNVKRKAKNLCKWKELCETGLSDKADFKDFNWIVSLTEKFRNWLQESIFDFLHFHFLRISLSVCNIRK